MKHKITIQVTGTFPYYRVTLISDALASAGTSEIAVGRDLLSGIKRCEKEIEENCLRPEGLPDIAWQQEIGAALYRLLFYKPGGTTKNEVGQTLDGFLETTENMDIRFVLDINDPELGALPWEMLTHPDSGGCLFRDVPNTLIRTVGRLRAKDLPAEEGLRIWVCLSSPTTLIGFNTWWAMTHVERTWRRWVGPNVSLEVEVEKPSKESFRNACLKHDIIYYVGHAGQERPGGPYGLFLTANDPLLAHEFATASDLASWASLGKVRLLVLNACDTTKVVREMVAELGPTARFPAVVAMHFEWPIVCAFVFQELFFKGLFLTGSVSEAAMFARRSFYVPRFYVDRNSPYWSFPMVLECAEPEQVDHILWLRTPIPDDGQESVGPIGLNVVQRGKLRDIIASTPGMQLRERWRSALRTAFGLEAALEPELPYRAEHRIQPFHIDRYPVTNRQYYRRYLGRGGDDVPYDVAAEEEHPVQVTFEEALEFCEKFGARLPTPKEWERAARGMEQAMLPWGDDLDTDIVDGNRRFRCNVNPASLSNAAGRAVGATPVHTYPPYGSPYGHGFDVADMIGNVPEFAAVKENGTWRVAVMGAGYTESIAANVPSFYYWLDRNKPEDRERRFGFRCVSPG